MAPWARDETQLGPRFNGKIDLLNVKYINGPSVTDVVV